MTRDVWIIRTTDRRPPAEVSIRVFVTEEAARNHMLFRTDFLPSKWEKRLDGSPRYALPVAWYRGDPSNPEAIVELEAHEIDGSEDWVEAPANDVRWLIQRVRTCRETLATAGLWGIRRALREVRHLLGDLEMVLLGVLGDDSEREG